VGLLSSIKQAYFKVGIRGAPRGTLLYGVHHMVEAVYMTGLRRKLIAPAQGRAARVAQLETVRPAAAADNTRKDVLVAFKITGGIGDHLVAARYIRDLLAAAGDFRFDVYSTLPEEAQWIFSTFKQLNDCFDAYFSWDVNFSRYPVAMYLSIVAVVYEKAADWGEVGKQNKRLQKICKTVSQCWPEIEPYFVYHPLTDAALARKAVFRGMKRHNFVQGISEIDYGGDVFPLAADTKAIEKFGLKGKRYVTIHNGFDVTQRHLVGKGKRATKCYPHFDKVIAGLRRRLPELYVVQVGATTSEPIGGVDLSLVGRAVLPETAEILRNSLLHIDNESGLVHLAACLGVKSCVIFGPTDPDFFAYEGNINLRAPFCGGCWWVTEDWMSTYPRGFGEARCLSEQRPATVIEAIASHLTGSGQMRATERPWPTLIRGDPPRLVAPAEPLRQISGEWDAAS
jgi:hypothetical protein